MGGIEEGPGNRGIERGPWMGGIGGIEAGQGWEG